MEDDKKKPDYKTIGVSGASGATLIGLLMYFQGQGIDMISKNIDANNKVMQARVISNTDKIHNNKDEIKELKVNYSKLSDQIRDESKETRKQNREDVERLSEIIRLGSNDRFTKTEYRSSQGAIDIRFQRIEDDLKELRDKNRN